MEERMDYPWRYHCKAGEYYGRTLWQLLTNIVRRRLWHWRRGDGWVD